MLKSLQSFTLIGCPRLEKFPDIHPEMNHLEELDLDSGIGIRELPSSLLYLTRLHKLELPRYLRNFLVGPNKSQMWEEEDIPSTKLRLASNCFNNFSGPTGFLCLKQLDLCDCPVESDSWMQPEYFPVLHELSFESSDIVTIPKIISRFTRLGILNISNCEKLRKIPTLPQSIRTVDAQNCYQLDTQSSSRLLNQVSLSFSFSFSLKFKL